VVGIEGRRIERGQRRSVTHLELACFASVVGLSYSGKLFIGRTRLRDATQLGMVNAYRSAMVAWGWQCRIEEPMPLTGDLRAFDLMLRADGRRVAHEFVSRLRDVQAQVRPLLRKQRDAGIGSLILVLRDTTDNRRAVLEAGPALRDSFPISARTVLLAMRERRDPGGNGIVFWRQPRITALATATAATRPPQSPGHRSHAATAVTRPPPLSGAIGEGQGNAAGFFAVDAANRRTGRAKPADSVRRAARSSVAPLMGAPAAQRRTGQGNTEPAA